MFDCLEKKATQSGFGRLVGMSKQAVSQRVADDQFKPDGTYAEWLSSYIDRLRQEASGRSEKQVAAVRARKELAQARREELELSKEMKLIISSDSLAPQLISIFKETQSQVMAAGNKCLQSIEAEHSIKLDDDIVLGPLRSALRNIAGGGDQLVASVTEKPSTLVSTAVAADGDMDRREHKAPGGKQ